MNITVVGSGYVGLVSSACFAKLGFFVTNVDKDAKKIADLCQKKVPIYEPGLDSLILNGLKRGFLNFTTNLHQSVKSSDVVMIAVGTPTNEKNGEADLSFVHQAIKEIAKAMNNYTIIVLKSTVPVGTSQKISKIVTELRPDLTEGIDYDVVSNPEFLREGSAINDFMYPDRIILGTNSKKAIDLLKELYFSFSSAGVPFIFTNTETAELIKYASNGFLALKISFINQMADLCEKIGGNIELLAKGMGLDKRIGIDSLKAGPGYGGSCFPKDTRALSQIASYYETPCSLVDETIKYNEKRKLDIPHKILRLLAENNNQSQKVAILGITFKPNTDDLRESPSLIVLSELLKNHVNISVYDPIYYKGSQHLRSSQELKKYFKDVYFAASPYEAVTGTNCVVVLTEWEEFLSLDMQIIAKQMSNSFKPIFMDFRNIYKPENMENFQFFSVGNCPTLRKTSIF